jgi:sulfoxide reductase heme-binding subunit YedZ
MRGPRARVPEDSFAVTTKAPRSDATLIAAATTVHIAIAIALLAHAGRDVAATQLALRTTARISFVWFIAAFVAAPLTRLWPGDVSLWLARRRRALGVIFGLSMSIHVGFILLLFALHAPARPPMVTDADFLIGIPGLAMVAMMTITSLDSWKRRLGDISWKRLHRTGIWVVWTIFFLCLTDSVSRKETNHPVMAYYLFIAILIAAAALRLAALRAGAPAADDSAA